MDRTRTPIILIARPAIGNFFLLIFATQKTYPINSQQKNFPLSFSRGFIQVFFTFIHICIFSTPFHKIKNTFFALFSLVNSFFCFIFLCCKASKHKRRGFVNLMEERQYFCNDLAALSSLYEMSLCFCWCGMWCGSCARLQNLQPLLLEAIYMC